MVNHKNFIFIHFPKTGGTFIEDFLYSNIKGTKKDHYIRHWPIFTFDDSDKDKKFKFATIRNPYSYWVSFWYFDKKRITKYESTRKMFEKGGKNNFSLFVKQILSRGDNLGPLLEFNIMKKLNIGILTYRYLYMLCHHDVFLDPKWEQNYKKYLMVDKIIKMENMVVDLTKMFERRKKVFGLSDDKILLLNKLPKKNKSGHKSPLYYFDSETKELIKWKERFMFHNFYNKE